MTKKITIGALLAIAVTGTAFAGPAVESRMCKEYKQPCVTPCFRDQEWQLDLFYSFNDATHQGTRRAKDRVPGDVVDTTYIGQIPQYFHDGSGGGIGVNYFFYRYFGIGVEGNWWDGVDAGSRVTVKTRNTVTGARSHYTAFSNVHREAAQQVDASLILRYPFEGPVCWAPYIFGGGGGVFDGVATGFGHVGLGMEFRLTPCIGLFADWRWQFMGRNGHDDAAHDINRFGRINGARNLRNMDTDKPGDVNMTRVGIRFVF